MGEGFIFGPEAEDAVYQFSKNLSNKVVAIVFFGFVSLCIYVGAQGTRSLSEKFFAKKKLHQKKPAIQEVFTAIEINDIEENKKAQKGIGRFFVKVFSFILAPIAVFILGVVAFYFFEIGKQDVKQAIASIPVGFQPVAFCLVGLTLGYLINVVANVLSKTMENLIFQERTMA